MLTAKNSKYNFWKHAPMLFAGITLICFAGWINFKNEMPVINISKQETALNVNKNILKYIAAGNKRLFTDLLWVQTLIESDIEHYKGDKLNSWLYLRFITIASLDPKFYENYLYGGQFLAIVKDDLEGADDLYDRGLILFPNDYHLNYNAGFLNYYEIGNYKKGIKLFEKIEDSPKAPLFFKSITSKLKASSGYNMEEVFNLVLHNYETSTDSLLKEKLWADLYAIKAEIDLKCLNNSGENCRTLDLEQHPYRFKDGKYYSPRKFTLFRIKRRGAKSLPFENKKIDTID